MNVIQVAGWTISQLPVGSLVHSTGSSRMPLYAVLCRRDGDAVVLDCGTGVCRGTTPGGYVPTDVVELREAVTAAGCPPDEVSTVVLSHLDTDHIGGIVTGRFPDELAPALPGARLVMLDTALAFVRNGPLHGAEESADVIVEALERAGVRVEGVHDGTEVVPGLFVHSAPGHRAANAFVDVVGGGERYVFLADVFHGPAEFAQPEARHGNPFDPDAAAASRVGVLEGLEGNELLSGAHFGFGRVERRGDGWLWIDLDPG